MGVQRTPKGFAVVDFETTGINPMGGDRAIEVGIVHVAPDGTLEDEAETLIRVQRDLGAQNLHHIHAADLMDAPDFAGIAAELRDWLDGYVFVAHNAVFDSRFLNAEYNRIGYTTPVDRTTSICTLRLSNRFLGLRSLDDCCRELGIRNTDAHSALGDAHATALLLSGFLHAIPDWEGWRPALRLAAELEWPRIDERPHPWVPRQSHAAHRPVSPFLNRLQSGNPGAARYRHHDAAMLDAAADYVALLDKCLIDARLSEHEKNALVDTARELGLTREQCLRIHEQYFADAADEAWIDGRLTDDEERELRQVGALLSIEPDMIDRAIAVPPFSDAATGRHAHRHSPAAPHHDADDVSSVQPDSGASPDSGSAPDSGTSVISGTSADAPDQSRIPNKHRKDRKDRNSTHHGRHRSSADAFSGDAQHDVVLGRPVVRSTTPAPMSGRGHGGNGGVRFRLHRGDRVVLTGAMERSRDEWIYTLEGLGLVVWPTVTMQVSLVIAADVDSESTKARKAREYGIPIVDEAWLDRAIRNGLIEE